jgi:hypothetical protein
MFGGRAGPRNASRRLFQHASKLAELSRPHKHCNFQVGPTGTAAAARSAASGSQTIGRESLLTPLASRTLMEVVRERICRGTRGLRGPRSR